MDGRALHHYGDHTPCWIIISTCFVRDQETLLNFEAISLGEDEVGCNFWHDTPESAARELFNIGLQILNWPFTPSINVPKGRCTQGMYPAKLLSTNHYKPANWQLWYHMKITQMIEIAQSEWLYIWREVLRTCLINHKAIGHKFCMHDPRMYKWPWVHPDVPKRG